MLDWVSQINQLLLLMRRRNLLAQMTMWTIQVTTIRKVKCQ